MGNEDGGQSSSDRNGSSDNEKPLKKARYVWEVKGKHHLKDKYKRKNGGGSSSSQQTTSREAAEEDMRLLEEQNNNNDGSNNNNNNNCENNNSSPGGGCSGRCCLDSILASSEAIMSYEDIEDGESSQSDSNKSGSDDGPVSLTTPNPKNEDYYLLRWQARQVAKGFVDNTINRVLEHWKVMPPFDAADFVENCDSDGHVEDEGILMAIQSHGLRQDVKESEGPGTSNTSHAPVIPLQEIAKSMMDNYENVNHESAQNVQFNREVNSSDEPISAEGEDPTDFLNKAVSVAISEKGLSSCNYE